ncbi:flavin reductase family protein [Actinorugispora endophytica]|uniref:Flavin reductase (DIM6/NTAB) family NADH-FMN oxidoreductase RutF n=1 Tax=Actinorugispora endophytica TaxID=1605990 RepID=A0A4R6UJT9_9ACTN|nr:flavin reductase family protein [Actinorugispora endophytica]TDQ47220.1 flavin reductase (DIM6/NTAB) family NADH-FMN oxidoreductase RutF [Actinorugispora endophytica]
MTSDNPREQSAPPLNHRRIEPRILYFGTPVVLVSTLNEDGTPNLAPISSAWALGFLLVMGLGATGQTARNLAARPELVVNLPAADQWRQVERLAPLTGRHPVPEGKPPGCRFEADKFGAAGLSPQPSELVGPPRVAECPLQLEARASQVRFDDSDVYAVVEADVLRVHAEESLVVPGTQHIDPARWNPLVYSFRHYFGLGPQRGHSYRSETPDRPDPASATSTGPGLER